MINYEIIKPIPKKYRSKLKFIDRMKQEQDKKLWLELNKK